MQRSLLDPFYTALGGLGAVFILATLVVEVVGIAGRELGLSMADIALAWLIAQPGVTSVIAGARNAEQARGIARACDMTLPAETMTRLSQVTDALKHRLGPNPDMWQGVSRMR